MNTIAATNAKLPNWTSDSEGRPEITDSVTGQHLRVEQHRDGNLHLSWRVMACRRPCNENEWTSLGGSFDSKMNAMADAIDYLEHHRQLAVMSRKEQSWTAGTGPWTIWDHAENCTTYGPDVKSYSTPGHGGFILSHDLNARVHPAWRNENRSYEEDCEWAIVAYTFPELFTRRERRYALDSLMRWHPHQYETVTGAPVPLERSHKLRQEKFLREHANDLLAIAAVQIGDGTTCKVWATPGGDRSRADETYAVPTSEYNTRGEFMFVVDPTRHPKYDRGIHGPT